MNMDIDLINQNVSKARIDTIKNKTASLAGEKELKEACTGFEAIFLNTMIKSMRDTLPGNALFEDSNSMDIYTSMQDQYFAEKLSKGNESIGIKDFLYQQLKDSK